MGVAVSRAEVTFAQGICVWSLICWGFFFRHARFFAAAFVRFYPNLRCLIRVPLHFVRLTARTSHDSMSMVFMSHFITSWYRSFGRPVALVSQPSSPNRRSIFGYATVLNAVDVAKNMPKMCVELSPFLLGVCSPCFAAVQLCSDDKSVVRCHRGLHHHLEVTLRSGRRGSSAARNKETVMNIDANKTSWGRLVRGLRANWQRYRSEIDIKDKWRTPRDIMHHIALATFGMKTSKSHDWFEVKSAKVNPFI